jgi:hypothetical protein
LVSAHQSCRRLLHRSIQDTASIKDSQQLLLYRIGAAEQDLLQGPSDGNTVNQKGNESLEKGDDNDDMTWWTWTLCTEPQDQNQWLSAAISAYGNKFQSHYCISIRTTLPSLFMQRALSFELKIRRSALQALVLSLPLASISVSSIVPETSPLMIACKEGDITKVMAIFNRHKGSPYDITPSNSTPLRVCPETKSFKYKG